MFVGVSLGISLPTGTSQAADLKPLATINPWESQVQVKAIQETRWYAEATRQERISAWYSALAEQKARPKQQISVQPKQNKVTTPKVSAKGTGRCGGDLPPCSVLKCESGGNLTAHNSSGADGKWQIMPGTWNHYGGYSTPSSAPEAVQDARAREIYAESGGRAWVCK